MTFKTPIIIIFVIIITLANYKIALGTLDNPPAPLPMKNVLTEPIGKRGTWFLGDKPLQLNKSHPIVFVQGLAVPVHEWWDKLEYHGKNDMYRLAHLHGYQTAFVQLYDKKRVLDQEENGKLLATLLEEIHVHFKEKVNIIAHSKGGIDTQTALVKYNAYRFVDRVITIGSPHHGSRLANLFRRIHLHTLVKKIGLEDSGLLALQTRSMETFRKQVDFNPNIKQNEYFTVSGTRRGPRLSLLWCGGIILSRYGPNDGLVNENSTHLPSYAIHLSTFDMDHDLLRKGSAIFSEIEPLLRKWKKINS